MVPRAPPGADCASSAPPTATTRSWARPAYCAHRSSRGTSLRLARSCTRPQRRSVLHWLKPPALLTAHCGGRSWPKSARRSSSRRSAAPMQRGISRQNVYGAPAYPMPRGYPARCLRRSACTVRTQRHPASARAPLGMARHAGAYAHLCPGGWRGREVVWRGGVRLRRVGMGSARTQKGAGGVAGGVVPLRAGDSRTRGPGLPGCHCARESAPTRTLPCTSPRLPRRQTRARSESRTSPSQRPPPPSPPPPSCHHTAPLRMHARARGVIW
jgi:hypothetical protein